jgi:hypothetical protein
VRVSTGSNLLDNLHDLHQGRETRQEFLSARTRDVGIELRREQALEQLAERVV